MPTRYGNGIKKPGTHVEFNIEMTSELIKFM